MVTTTDTTATGSFTFYDPSTSTSTTTTPIITTTTIYGPSGIIIYGPSGITHAKNLTHAKNYGLMLHSDWWTRKPTEVTWAEIYDGALPIEDAYSALVYLGRIVRYSFENRTELDLEQYPTWESLVEVHKTNLLNYLESGYGWPVRKRWEEYLEEMGISSNG